MITDLAAEQAKRTQRAYEGLSAGRLKVEPLMHDQWNVINGDNAPYLVQRLDDGSWSCTCSDFIERGKINELRCKHIEAVRFLQDGSTEPGSGLPEKGEPMSKLFKLTYDEQVTVLTTWLPPEWALKTDKKVAHGKPFVWHEFTRIMLDRVFGPMNWSAQPLQEVTAETLPNADLLIYAPVGMTLTFANGRTARRADVGIGLVQARIQSPDLSDQATDSWETGYKSAVTDGLKGCAADLGRCFRPLMSGNMAAAVRDARFADVFSFPNGERTLERQVELLWLTPPAWAVQSDPQVAGGKPWTPHEYVVQTLDMIFGPDGWSYDVLSVAYHVLPNSEAQVHTTGQLSVTFADGSVATRFDVGIAPIRRKKDAVDLVATPAENYETAFKASVTDALKGCAGDLGNCFRPFLAADVERAVKTNLFDGEFRRLRPVASDALETGKRALGRDDTDLVTASTPHPAPTVAPAPKAAAAVALRLFGDGTPVKTDDPIEYAAYEKYRAAHDQVAPLNVNALRVWAHLYSDGSPVADDARARKVFDDYVNEHAGSVPAASLVLRTWHQVKSHSNGRQPAAAAA